jgi:hypothetical protein
VVGRYTCPLRRGRARRGRDHKLCTFQLAFALDRIKALAPKHPEWKTTQPFRGVIEGDTKAVLASGEHGLMQILAASHFGNTTDEFAAVVSDWIAKARPQRRDKEVLGPSGSWHNARSRSLVSPFPLRWAA